MEALLRREGFDLVIDATHPYAAEVTENIVRACEAVGTEYLRLLRGSGDAPQGAVCVPDIGAAVTYLAGTEGNILLTTPPCRASGSGCTPGCCLWRHPWRPAGKRDWGRNTFWPCRVLFPKK